MIADNCGSLQVLAKIWRDGNSYIAVIWYNHFGIVWYFLKKLNIHPSFDLTISLLGIYPREIRAYVHTKTCT